jgi:hypothetical protein
MSAASAPNLQLWGSRPRYRTPSTRWIVIAIVALLVPGFWSCSSKTFSAVRTAEGGVQHFHELFNQGQYQQICQEAGDEFRKSGSQAELVEFFDKVHKMLGNVSRTGSPAYFVNVSTQGTFVRLTYDTEFAQGKGQETFVWRIESDGPRLVGYNLSSRDLIVK